MQANEGKREKIPDAKHVFLKPSPEYAVSQEDDQ